MPDHIINKEILEFTYSDTEYAFALQKQMNSGLQYKMQSLVNSTLDNFNEDGETIRLDKLEIDLGKIPFGELENILPIKFQAEFRDKLYTAVFEKKLVDKKKSTGISGINDPSVDQLELLEIFLLSGSLPWWAGRAVDFSLNDLILTFIRENPAGLKSLFCRYIDDEKIISRLFYQTDTITSLEVAGLLGISREDISVIKNSFHNNILPLLPHASATEIKNILRLLISIIHIHDPRFSYEQKNVLLLEKIRKIFGYTIDLNSPGTAVNNFLNDIYQTTKHVAEQVLQTNPLINQQVNKRKKIENKEKIYLQNAGLVLISPFLPALFKELKWIEEKKILNKDLQFKAIFLLHYLTTGTTEAPEYTLQLNKILCGVEQDEPIPFSVDLTEKEKQEAYQLLKDIITHWEALKDSSATVLQGSFLIRDGLLSFTNDHWLIQIERTGYDILLDQIPWSWKMIQLDWMDTYIETEW